jgi:hypothetical protein
MVLVYDIVLQQNNVIVVLPYVRKSEAMNVVVRVELSDCQLNVDLG